MEDVYVVGVGMTPFGRMLDTDIKTMTKEAINAALADAGLKATALEGAYFANASQGHMEKQHMVRGQIALDQKSFERAEVDLLEAYRGLAGLHHTLEEIDVVLRLAQLAIARGDRDAARQRVAELGRLNLSLVRPDLIGEFERLKLDLTQLPGSGGGGASSPPSDGGSGPP